MDLSAHLVISRRRERHVPPLIAALTLLCANTACIDPGRAPLGAFLAGGHEAILADTPPLNENDVYSASRGEARLTAAIGETVGLQLVLHANGGSSEKLDVVIDDLAGASGQLRRSDCVRLFHAQYVRAEHVPSWYPDHTARAAVPVEFPDILVPWEASRGGGPVNVKGNHNEIVWIDIRIPATVEAGEYTGRIHVVQEAPQRFMAPREAPRELFSCTLHVRVLPVALPSAPSLPLICRVDPMDLLEAHLRWPREPAEQLRIVPDSPSHRAALRLISGAMQLFAEHRTTPVLWAAFPKFRPTGERQVEVQWEDYDRLIGPLIDGTAYAQGVPASMWPAPVSAEFPNADVNGGFSSPQYSRLLAAYLAECARHFKERGWLERAFVRLREPSPLSDAEIERLRRLAGIVRQSESGFPFVAHVPPKSLRGLGWEGAPLVDLNYVDVWATRAMWSEPDALGRERNLGRKTWLLPDFPPYSGSLAVIAPPTDPRSLPWQAFRYEAGAIWVEHAADKPRAADPSALPIDEPLIYPGQPYGFVDQPVPSMRLKRLRQGLQDYELLHLMEQRGRRLFAEDMSRQLIRWAETEAGVENLLTTREAGWPRDPSLFALARDILLQELANQSEPSDAGASVQIADLARMARMMNQADRIRAEVRGVRLTSDGNAFTAHMFCSASNLTNRNLGGAWIMPTIPVGWQPVAGVPSSIPASARRGTALDCPIGGLSYNVSGVQPLDLVFRTEEYGDFPVAARLAVAGCPLLEEAPVIDGNLADWRTATNSVAADFKLVRGHKSAADVEHADRPTLGTTVFFSRDRGHLYIGVKASLPRGERPMWRADNNVPLDGAVPWGQDLIEVLIDPRAAVQGGSNDIFCLQIKPSGMLVESHGCRTDPPLGRVEEWRSGARVAAQVFEDAWVTEIALPIASLGDAAARNALWGVNVSRLDARRGEYSSWSGARGHCYSPEVLGNLILIGP